MAEEKIPPILLQPIPDQVVNEGASFGPLYLASHIISPNPDSGSVTFSAELLDGRPLSQGLICAPDGTLSGIPADNTQGSYTILITAKNASEQPFTTQFNLIIKERLFIDPAHYTNLKAKVWESLGQDLPLPTLDELIHRPVSMDDVYYFLERFAVFYIWDVYNLDPPSEKKLLQLEGVSKHFNVYDKGCCIVGAPKELFSHERTLEDALQTSRAMAREAFKRNWTVEFSGLHAMKRASWVELQLLGDKEGRKVQIFSHSFSERDMQLYLNLAESIQKRPQV